MSKIVTVEWHKPTETPSLRRVLETSEEAMSVIICRHGKIRIVPWTYDYGFNTRVDKNGILRKRDAIKPTDPAFIAWAYLPEQPEAWEL